MEEIQPTYNRRKSTVGTIVRTVILLAFVVAVVLISPWLMKRIFDVYWQNVLWAFLIIAFLYGLMIVAVIVLCKTEKQKISALGFTKKHLPSQILIGLGFGVGLFLILGLAPVLLKIMYVDSSPWSALNLVYAVYKFAIVGVGEELVFRGYVQTQIDKVSPRKFIAPIVTAVLFGLWHIFNANWWIVIVATVVGLLFGFARVYIKRCSLLSVMIAHGLYDFSIVMLAWIF
ncbi:MAG: CPBP family intramembrane metalloprotease [Clostridiales bacterium]|nr:CPBP family intramembrane metalloprotease [Clostridiales bacterium]